MSRMSDLHIYIKELIEEGLSYEKIVDRIVFEYGLSETYAENMVYDVETSYIEDAMDDRFDSGSDADALSSAGFGTDEDYGAFDDYNYDYD